MENKRAAQESERTFLEERVSQEARRNVFAVLLCDLIAEATE